MDRSPRFRVYPHALDARFRLAFASAPDLRPLTSRMRSNSPDHNAKGTPSPASDVRRRGTGSDRLYAHGFRFCFTRRQAFFSPFPHGTGPLSVTDSYLALEDGPPGFSQGSTCPGLLGVRASRPTRISHTGLSPSAVVRSSTVPLCFGRPPTRPHNPRAGHPVRVWALPFSLAATLGISIDFFSSRYLDVSVPWVGSLERVTGFAPAGLPHSDTPGSRLACSSPGLIAACHVLHRRSVPRHPPCALLRLTSPCSSNRTPNRDLRPFLRSAAQLGQSTVAFPTRTLLARPSQLRPSSGQPWSGRPERPKALYLPSTLAVKNPDVRSVVRPPPPEGEPRPSRRPSALRKTLRGRSAAGCEADSFGR